MADTRSNTRQLETVCLVLIEKDTSSGTFYAKVDKARAGGSPVPLLDIEVRSYDDACAAVIRALP
jgi:hypothetical protein